MSMFDTNFKMGTEVAFDTQTISSDTTTQGNEIDLNDGSNDFEALELVLATGNYTDGDYSLSLEEADEPGGSFTAVDSEDIVGDNTAISADNSTLHIGYVGKKRVVRISVVSASTTTGSDVTVLAIKQHPRSAPLN